MTLAGVRSPTKSMTFGSARTLRDGVVLPELDRDGDPVADLAVDLDDQLGLIDDQQGRIEVWPRLMVDRVGLAQPLPHLFGDKGRRRRHQKNQRLDCLAPGAGPDDIGLTLGHQGIGELDQGGDHRVGGKPFDVASDLPDGLMREPAKLLRGR